MWKDEYWENGTTRDLCRDIGREDDGTPREEIRRYEVVFDVEGERRYCYIDAINIDEALGMFFRNHDTVTYKDIVDHMEV